LSLKKAVCTIVNDQACFRGVELTDIVVTRVFHAVTLKGWSLAGHGWYTSKCGSYVCEKNTVSGVYGSERLITLKFKYEVEKLSPSVTDDTVYVLCTLCITRLVCPGTRWHCN